MYYFTGYSEPAYNELSDIVNSGSYLIWLKMWGNFPFITNSWGVSPITFRFTLKDKYDIIQKIQSCVKQSDICHEMNLTKSSVCTIWTKRKQIRVKWLAGDNFYIWIKFYHWTWCLFVFFLRSIKIFTSRIKLIFWSKVCHFFKKKRGLSFKKHWWWRYCSKTNNVI
jgi:hypothetical protein